MEISAKQLHNAIKTGIKIYDANEAESIADIIVEYISGTNRLARVSSNPILNVDEATIEKIIIRLNNAEPIQYITGYADFYGRKFKVNKYTLIPRQETEELVHLIIKRHSGKTLSMLDIGTGSGCIPITLKLELNNCTLTSVDVSTEAIQVAKENAGTNKATVNFYIDDLLKGLPTTNDKFDIIVSNPPYVTLQEKSLMHKNVLDHEPHLALFVPEDDPLIFYRKIAETGHRIAREGAKFYMEINEHLGKKTAEIFNSMNYTDVELIKDLHGKDRIMCAKKL
ncbi:MAG: peptide chain release factor N(5)-glutamine methyltransferase [Cytophagaceae bacterium]